METVTGGEVVTRADVRPGGSFEIPNIQAGTYQLSVTDGHGETLWHELVRVVPGAMPLIIEVDRGVRERLGGGTVSITRLRQRPPADAIRELKLAERASGKGRLLESIQHLRHAAELAPGMQDVRNNLGAQYLRSGDCEAARRELEAAVALDPDAPIPHANLALTLLTIGRASEAAAEARLALRRDPLSAGANYAAGAALARQGKFDEAFRYLDRAIEREPQALLVEARILIVQSKPGEAAAKLRAYLSRPGVPQRAEVTSWLSGIPADGAH